MESIVLVPGFEVSEFCLGLMPWGSRVAGAEADGLLHAFRDAGGTIVDTAHCYAFWTPNGAGCSECALGDYLERNGGRDELVIATKGAHPPMPKYRRNDRYMTRERIAADLDDSLGRMRIDTIDLYWLHRDDPRVPVGEILEMLMAEVRRGRIRYYGGSNWTAARLAEANAYAAEHGLQPMVASQPCWNLGLREPFRNDLHWFDETDGEWHRRSKLPVLPYSPTAQGFFATAGASGQAYRNAASQERLARARKVADEMGATPNQIALAWLRHQPFPVIPILGTADAEHLRDALGAVHVRLTPEQVRWLRQG
ncbi:MAG: aldo/keto reductase [Lentisphaeria bacterium]|nr:aldo/keto reductase [Lentisphaeria bacterium]